MLTASSVLTSTGKNIHLYKQFPFQQVEMLTASSVLTPTGKNIHLYKQFPFQQVEMLTSSSYSVQQVRNKPKKCLSGTPSNR